MICYSFKQKINGENFDALCLKQYAMPNKIFLHFVSFGELDRHQFMQTNLKNEKKRKFKQLYPNCFCLTDFIP